MSHQRTMTENGFDSVDERLFGTGNDEVHLSRFTRIKISFLQGQGQIVESPRGAYVAPHCKGDEGVKVLGRDRNRDGLVAKERAAITCQGQQAASQL